MMRRPFWEDGILELEIYLLDGGPVGLDDGTVSFDTSGMWGI